LKGKSGAVDVEVTSPPGEETVDQTDESNDTKQRSNDTQGNLDTEHGTVGESVKDVFGLVFLVTGNSN
jgi:hypothetical protein